MNSSNTPNNNISLSDIADEAMRQKGFYIDFSPEANQELERITAAASAPDSFYVNRVDLLWVSIDNDDSKDLDQLTYAEKMPDGQFKIYVAIADVDTLVKRGSAIDNHAENNTTSVYTPSKIFPMLPLKLSTNLTSLNEKETRCAIVVESIISKNGSFSLSSIYPALVCNQAKLTYNGVAAWLDNKTPFPDKIKAIPGLIEQLQLQDSITDLISGYRQSLGSLNFKTVEIKPLISNGKAVNFEEVVINRAHHLIENYMIASNASMAMYLIQNNLPIVRRIVRTPERWDRIVKLAHEKGTLLPPQPDVKALQHFLDQERDKHPENFADLSLAIIKLIGRGEYVVTSPTDAPIGHFDLALTNYAHTTAPNRRFPDVINQRILKSHLKKTALPYSRAELDGLAEHCTQKEDDATKVERWLRKSAMAMIFAPRIGEQFSAMVTGASEKGTWVRLLEYPIEGKLVQGYKGLDVGDRVQVVLTRVDVPHGYIDFKTFGSNPR